MQRQISISKKTYLKAVLLYIYVPLAIFVLGWIRAYISIPVVLVSGYFVYKMYHCFRVNGESEEQGIQIRLWVLGVVLVFLAGICYLAGWGGWAPQAGDWNKHNAIMHDMVERSWPVYYNTSGDVSMLTYYIGQYVLPSFVGKIFHSFRIAELAQFIWCYLGLVLVYLGLLRVVVVKQEIKKLLVALYLVFFSGMLLVAQRLLLYFFEEGMISFGDYHWVRVYEYMLQYRSNFVDLRWVFPQCLVAWITVLLFREFKEEIQHYVILMIPVMLYSTFPFLAFVFLASGYVVMKLIFEKDKFIILKKVISISNITVAVTLGGILLTFFSGNIFSEKPESIGMKIMSYGGKRILVYLIFCFFMFGLYSLLIFKDNFRNKLFITANLLLLALPFFQMGIYNDLLMCVSIPALFIIEIEVLRFLFKATEDKIDQQIKGFLIAILLVASMNPLMEMLDVYQEDSFFEMERRDTFVTMEGYANREDDTILYDVAYNYYTYDLDQSIFVKYLASKPNK